MKMDCGMLTTTQPYEKIFDWQPKLAGERKLLQVVAAHEAAHACVGNCLGLVVAEVAVFAACVPPELHAAKFMTADVIGFARWETPEGGVYTDAFIRARMLTFLAGPVQSCLSRGRPLGGGKDARDEARALASACCLVDEEDAPTLVESARAEVRELVFINRHAIAALAKRLESERTIRYPFDDAKPLHPPCR